MVFVKCLRLRGFKSVGATHTVQIDFDKGFSAIVGANGSGKSNILEGFSFVMGNLSAKSLRGENLRQMIFSGNEKVKIPAAKEAWVELALDNADRGLPIDADLVKISRSIDTEGKGKYKINGVASTRTEVQDLLALGGLTSNGYSMVLQGNVAEVVNMGKLERRKLIEDIAGIAAYDEKKQGAEKELETVETNLAQVRLLMNEVATQLAALEKEKDAALKYQHLQHVLETASLALKLHDIASLRSDIGQLKCQAAELKQKVEETSSLIQEKEAELEATKGRIKDLHDELASKQGQELFQLNQSMDQLKQTLVDIKSNAKYLSEGEKSALTEQARLGDDLQRLEQEQASLDGDIEALKQTLATHQDTVAGKQALLQAKTDELANQDRTYQELISRKEVTRQELMDAKASLNEIRSEIKLAETYVANNRTTLQSIEQKAEQAVAARANIETKLETLQAELSETGEGSVASPDKIQAEITRMEADLKATRDAIRKKSEAVMEIRSTTKAIQAVNSNGPSRAITALTDAKNKGVIDGIYDIVGNLGKADAKYQVALDVAASGKTNFMVVRDRDTATACINYLKKNNLGRLSFIPLDKISYREYDHNHKLVTGVHGRAVDLLDFDNTFLPAFEFIFGRTFIVDDLAVAREFAPDFKRVTLDGDVIDPSNLMTGGSYNKKGLGSAFQSKDEGKLPALERELQVLKDQERATDKAIRESQGKISDYYSTKINAEKQRSNIREQIAKLEAKLEELENGTTSNSDEVASIEATISEQLAKKEAALTESATMEARVAEIEKGIADIDSTLENSPHAALKAELDIIEKGIKTTEAAVNKTNLAIAQKSTRLEEHVNITITKNRSRIEELAATIEETRQQIEAKDAERAETEAKIEELDAAISSKNKELSGLLLQKKEEEKAREDLAAAIQRLVLERQSGEIKANGASVKIAELDESLRALEKDVPAAATMPEEYLESGRPALVQEIASSKAEVEKMGAVNMMAIEKYNDNKARFDELLARHDILVKERESILEFMASIETQKKAAFMQAFQSIARNFAYIFSRLSPDGEGKLELENLDDPFNGGVLIMARPSGKPLNEISLLSGGEKALTSLSLIFAIQQHCPSPLYILDEIDAAFDDANASRVADLIKELSARSQFIVVTHRDVTMTRVDQILGVSNVDGVTEVMGLHLSEITKLLESERAIEESIA
jgi:chromosome segregation protein